MNKYLYCLPLMIWGAMDLAPRGPVLWAADRNTGDLVELGALKSRAPADWVEEKPNNAQGYKQYRLRVVRDDTENARLTIQSVDRKIGDSALNEVQRWKETFLPPRGKEMNDVAKTRELKVPGGTITYLDVRGDYKGIPGDPTTPRGNYRLLGVYFATPQGDYLIRLFGPAETVEFYREGFENWVKAFTSATHQTSCDRALDSFAVP
jgi:hypothetical protein